jgi:enoyl-CoA hydratase
VLRIDAGGPVRSLILCRPQAGNALNLALVDALQLALEEAAADDSVRALVITGEGRRFFCAGGDIKEFSAISDEAALFDMLGRVEGLFRTIGALRIPVIAAVNGYALGAGAELALACDLRIAGSEAQLGFVQARVGVLPTRYSLNRLRAVCGHGAASELILSAAALSAQEAATAGLCSRVVAAGEEHSAALELAASLAKNCPLAMAAAKELLSPGALAAFELDAESRRLFPPLWFSPFHRGVERSFKARSRQEESR